MRVYRRRNKNGVLSKKYSYDFFLKGKRYRGSTYLENREEARAFAFKKHDEIKNKVIWNIKNPSFLEALTYYKKYKTNYLKGLSKSVKSQCKLTFKLALDFFANQEFNKENILTFILETQTKRELSDRTMLKYIAPLKVLCKFCHSQGELTLNPFEQIDLKEINKSRNAERVRFLTKAEHKILFSKLKDTIILDYAEFAIETGLRIGEQLDLEWDRIYFDEKNIYLDETKTDAPRTVPITPKAFEILQKRFNQNLEKPFPFLKGKVHDHWSSILKSTTIEDFTWHDFRHTFASWSVKGWHSWQFDKKTGKKKGMDIYKLSKWLGHKNIKMTMKYAHLDVDDLHEEIEEEY